MNLSKREYVIFGLMSVTLLIAIGFHLFAGQIPISFDDYYNSLFHFNEADTNQLIAREFRFPRLFITLLAGSGLSIAGMLMQTLFNNPLAGPYVLGINSGSSLFVAISLMSGLTFFNSDLGIILSALLGALVFGFIILGFSFFIKSQISLLLIGLMLGSFTGAIITTLQTFSTAQELKVFTIWTMGSLQQVELSQVPIILFFFLIACFGCLFLIKPLNVLVLGEKKY